MEFQFPPRRTNHPQQATVSGVTGSTRLGNKYSCDSIVKKRYHTHPKIRRVRSRSSKLDLVDDDMLTSFPRLSQGSIQSQESIRIVDDYFKPRPVAGTTTTTSEKFGVERDRERVLHRTCGNCAKNLTIGVNGQQYTEFLCAQCAQTTPIFASSIVRMNSLDNDDYFVLIQKQWYNSLRHKLRWRWRIRGLM